MHTSMLLTLFIFGLSFSLSKSKVTTYIFFFLLFLVASLRFGEGPDYFAYYDAFNALSSNPFEELEKPLLLNQELGFRLIGSTLKFLGFNYQSYLAVFALVSCFYIARLSLAYSVYPVMTGLLFYAAFFFTWPYSGIRQGFVLCVGSYYLVRCAKENRMAKFLGVTGILSLVHVSAVILPVFFFLQKIKKSPATQFLIIGIGLILAIAIQKILLANIGLLPFSERILFYEEYFFESSYLDVKTLSRVFIFAITMRIYVAAKKHGDEFLAGLCSALMSSFIVYVLFKFSEIAAAQLSLYGFFLLTLVLPNFLAIKDRFLPKNIYFILIVIFSSLYFSKTYTDMKYMSEKNAYKEGIIK